MNTGSNKTNVLGVWAKKTVKAICKRPVLQEITNSSLINDGHFGLLV